MRFLSLWGHAFCAPMMPRAVHSLKGKPCGGNRGLILRQLAKVAFVQTQLVYWKLFTLSANLANSIARVGQVGPVGVCWTTTPLRSLPGSPKPRPSGALHAIS